MMFLQIDGEEYLFSELRRSSTYVDNILLQTQLLVAKIIVN